jgi:hypothetical protein
MSSFTLDIYNWTGATLWGGGTGNDTDKVYFGPDLSDAALAKIRFHSGAVNGGDSFLGSGFDLGLQQMSWDSGLDGYHIIPVPEPETYATGVLLLLGAAIYQLRLARQGRGLLPTFLRRIAKRRKLGGSATSLTQISSPESI